MYFKKVFQKVWQFKQNFSQITQKLDERYQIQNKAQQLANLIKQSKYPIIFTGAGISTSIGIPDYRSGTSTIVNTGPGLWNRPPKGNISHQNGEKSTVLNNVDRAKPSLTHMAIKTLLQKKIVKFVVSQNTDGLHLRSGIAKKLLAELHGNRNLQVCRNCNNEYLRDFGTLRDNGKKSIPGQKRSLEEHKTGRKCENCSAQLYDSIVYFGQKLPFQQLDSAFRHSTLADLCICLGTSLTVQPSSNIPINTVKNKGKLCLINIQQTPLDHYAFLKVNSFCDDFMVKMMQKLEIQIQKYIVQHYIYLIFEKNNLSIQGVDLKGSNISFIKSITTSLGQIYEKNGHKIIIAVQNDNVQFLVNFYGNHKIPCPIKCTSIDKSQLMIKIIWNDQQEKWYQYFKRIQ